MRKVTFLISLFILFPLTLNAQPPKPRRATESKAMSDPYLKWFSFMREFGARGGLTADLSLSPDGRTIFIAGTNGPVLLPAPYPNTQINLRTTKSVKEVLQKERITDYVLSPDLQRIFIDKPNPRNRRLFSYEVWNPHNAKRVGDIPIAGIHTFSPDGQMFAVVYASPPNRIVAVWNPHNAKRIRRITISDTGNNLSFQNILFSPDGQMLALTFETSTSRDVIIELWNPDNGKRIRRITVPKRGFKTCDVNSPTVFSPDGQMLVAGIERSKGSFRFRSEQERVEKAAKYTKNSIEFLNPHNGKQIASVELPTEYGGATSLVFSPDGQILAGAMASANRALTNTIFLWNPHTGKHLRTLQTESSVRSVVFSPDGQILAPSNGIDTIPLWNPHTGEVIRTLKHNVKYEDFKPGEISGTSKTRGDFSDLEIRSFTFNPNGRIAAAVATFVPVFWEIPEAQ